MGRHLSFVRVVLVEEEQRGIGRRHAVDVELVRSLLVQLKLARKGESKSKQARRLLRSECRVRGSEARALQGPRRRGVDGL